MKTIKQELPENIEKIEFLKEDKAVKIKDKEDN